MKWVAAAVYRIRQMLGALWAELQPWRLPDLGDYLNQEQQVLFQKMSRADQRHSLAVWYALQQVGANDPVLLQAALLHDVGKADSRIHIWQRAGVVLLRTFAPGLVERWVAERPGDWRRPFYLYQEHPRRGAELAQAAGASAAAVDLIREHHAPLQAAGKANSFHDATFARRLELLQRADGTRM